MLKPWTFYEFVKVGIGSNGHCARSSATRKILNDAKSVCFVLHKKNYTLHLLWFLFFVLFKQLLFFDPFPLLSRLNSPVVNWKNGVFCNERWIKANKSKPTESSKLNCTNDRRLQSALHFGLRNNCDCPTRLQLYGSLSLSRQSIIFFFLFNIVHSASFLFFSSCDCFCLDRRNLKKRAREKKNKAKQIKRITILSTFARCQQILEQHTHTIRDCAPFRSCRYENLHL